MKFKIILLVLCLAHLQGQAQFSLIETITCDLNADGKADSILLYRTATYDETNEPGRFERIDIRLNGEKTVAYDALDTWGAIEQDFKGANAVGSDLVFVLPERERTLLVLFGHSYPTGQELWVLQIAGENVVPIFREEGQWDTIRLIRPDPDGAPELLLRSWSEPCIAPYRVYTLGNPAEVNPARTQKYNEEHYLRNK